MDRRYFSLSDLRWENLAISKWTEPSNDENRVILFLTLSLSLSAWSALCAWVEKENRCSKTMMHFRARARSGSCSHAHKDALSIRVTARTRRAEQEWENQERERWTLSIFNSIFIARRLDSLEAANVFSAWI